MVKVYFPEIDSGGLSEAGLERDDNQDAIRLSMNYGDSDRGHLYAVADGMGGYEHGELASRLALDTLFETFYAGAGGAPPQQLRRGVEQANLAVCQLAQKLGARRMGTTLTAANVIGRDLHIAHVGDTRAYLIRGGKAACLTNDHTTVGELVRLRVLPTDKVRTHDQRSVLTKCLGLALFVQPDISRLTLRDNDRIVLCSDGVWTVIQDEEFARLAGHTWGAAGVSRRMVETALERQSDDNASVVTVHVRRTASAPAEGKRRWTDLFRRRMLSGV